MALRDNNPNDGKIHCARLRGKGSKVKASPVVKSRRNKVKRGSGIMPAIVRQETAAMSRAKFLNENRSPTGESCFESQNR